MSENKNNITDTNDLGKFETAMIGFSLVAASLFAQFDDDVLKQQPQQDNSPKIENTVQLKV